MGIIRKSMSVGTAGIVSYRNDKERAAKVAKQTRNATRAQVVQNAAMLNEQRTMNSNIQQGNAQQQAQWIAAQQQAQPAGPPPGWYVDPQGSGMERWFDGAQYTEHMRPVQGPQV